MHFIGSALLESLSLWEQRRRPPPAALPSQALTRQLSQRESPWQAGQVSSGRAKLICFVDCSALLSRPAALPSQALTRQLSQRESPWQAGQVSSGRAKLICFVDCSALLSRPAAA